MGVDSLNIEDWLRRIANNEVDEREAIAFAVAKTGRRVLAVEKVLLDRTAFAALDGTNEDVIYYARSLNIYSATATTLGLTQDLVTVNQLVRPTSVVTSNASGVLFNKQVALPGNPGDITCNAYKITLDPWTYGPEILVNGDFASGTGWAGANWTIAAGTATHVAGATNNLAQAIVSPAGVYKTVFTINSVTTSNVTIGFVASGSPAGTARSTAATFTEYITVGGAATFFFFTPGSTFDGVIDNVSLKLRVPQQA